MAVLFGDTIRNLRVSRKMTQAQLSQRIGVARPMISAYENETRQPSHETLIKIAGVFNVSMDYLYNYKNGQKESQRVDISGIDQDVRAALEELIQVIREKEK